MDEDIITQKFTNALDVAPIEFFSPELLRRTGSKKREEPMAIKTIRTSSVSDSSALLRKGSDKQKNSTSTGTISRTNSEKRGNKRQPRSTGENTTSTMTILSERRQHRTLMAQPKASKHDDEEDDVFAKKDMVTKNEKRDR